MSAYQLTNRFRHFFPVIIDVETGGFNAHTDALLEIAAITLSVDAEGNLIKQNSYHYHITPFEGANLEEASLAITGIDPHHPFRFSIAEDEALKQLFKEIRKEQKAANCQKSILVGHNATFDLGFLKAATLRNKLKKNPFHPFSTFDTATLSGLAFGQTVLSKACQAAGLDFDSSKAHSALYDAQITADLFCHIVNLWNQHFSWPDN